MQGAPIYETGKACSACPAGMSQCDDGLCSTGLAINDTSPTSPAAGIPETTPTEGVTGGSSPTAGGSSTTDVTGGSSSDDPISRTTPRRLTRRTKTRPRLMTTEDFVLPTRRSFRPSRV